jgi:hypothetical protein
MRALLLLALVLSARPAEAHLIAFPHTVEVRFAADRVDVVQVVQLHPGDPALPPGGEAVGRALAERLARGGPTLRFGGAEAVCGEATVEATLGRTVQAVVSRRCARPPGALSASLSGASALTPGLVPVTIFAPLTSPTLEGEGAPLAGRGDGPWVGALAGGATLRFDVPSAAAKLPASEDP